MTAAQANGIGSRREFAEKFEATMSKALPDCVHEISESGAHYMVTGKGVSAFIEIDALMRNVVRAETSRGDLRKLRDIVNAIDVALLSMGNDGTPAIRGSGDGE